MSDGKTITLTREELREMMEDVVNDTLTKIGLEPDGVGELQRDFIYLRKLRETSDQVRERALFILVGTIVLAGVGAIGMAVKSFIAGAMNSP